MQIERLDHFTLRTDKLEETRQFFEQVLGLSVGYRPPFQFPGYWLYVPGVKLPLVHLARFDESDEQLRAYLGDRGSFGTGTLLDHIAFRCRNLPAFEQRLRDLGVMYQPRTVPALGEHQVFVRDPNGMHLEFIFASDEPSSWRADASGIALSAPDGGCDE